MRLITYEQKPPLNAHADAFSGARVLISCLSLHLHPYFLYRSRESSEESGHCAGSPEPSLIDTAIIVKSHLLAYTLKSTGTETLM